MTGVDTGREQGFDLVLFSSEHMDKEFVAPTDDVIKNMTIANGNACVDMCTPIYRIFPIERFAELMVKKTISFAHPKKWEDPAEYSFITRTQKLNGTKVEKSKDWDLHGQCWSMNKSCDGLWRAYTNNKAKLAVQVETTIGGLLKAYVNTKDKMLQNLFCGKVIYKPGTALQENMMQTDASGFLEDLSSLFYKRDDFKYEEEVRFVVSLYDGSLSLFENSESVLCDQYSLFAFSDLAWIDRCAVSPWASSMEEGFVKELAKLGGLDTVNVKKSDLYEAW